MEFVDCETSVSWGFVNAASKKGCEIGVEVEDYEYVHVLTLLGDYDCDCEHVMTNHALQCSLVSDSNVCCCETHVEIVIETWTVGASAEHYDYVSESKNVAQRDVFCNIKFEVLFIRSLSVTRTQNMHNPFNTL